MSLQFARVKNIRAGMSFLNGIPLPDDPGGVQKLFAKEQQHIMELVMSGDISNEGPKSVYGMLLTGDNVFSKHHPLLMESKGRFLNRRLASSAETLLFPEGHETSVVASSDAARESAVFVIEAVLDFQSSLGVTMAVQFLSAMKNIPRTLDGEEGDPISVAYRLRPSRRMNIETVESMVSSVAPDLKQDDRRYIVKACMSEGLDEAAFDDLPAANFFMANGRVLVPDGESISGTDIEMLLSMEYPRSRAVTRALQEHIIGSDGHDAIAKAAAFIAQLLSSENSVKRVDLSSLEKLNSSGVDAGEESQSLYFTWNDSEAIPVEMGRILQVKVTAILDPLSEATQRVSPLLRAIRDQLKLPLALMLAPRTIIEGDDAMPVSSYYRFVADPLASFNPSDPKASFTNLPTNHVLTMRMDVPEPWNVQQKSAVQDTDNLRCDFRSGCSDEAYIDALGGTTKSMVQPDANRNIRIGRTVIKYGLNSLLFFGQCYDVTNMSPPNGLQLTIDQKPHAGLRLIPAVGEIEVQPDGTMSATAQDPLPGNSRPDSLYKTDTLVMKTVGYWQLRAKPGVFTLEIAEESRGSDIFEMVEGKVVNGAIKVDKDAGTAGSKKIVMKDFVSNSEVLLVKRRTGYENAELYRKEDSKSKNEDDTVHVFSLATGHLYERFLKIMMLSVTKRTSSKVKFWLFENFLSPSFKATATAMAEQIGCELGFVTYKWPEWLRGQSEKQRIIWGYKILFLDVLFPLDVKKVIYIDADQVVRGNMKELVDLDLKGAPYGYTPMCSSREETQGYAFWNTGFWKSHLRGKPYHISALYVVDLARFRRELVGDKLRNYYQSLSADPASLSNLDQDLPNYAQHDVKIFSLPQEWLWCESWCSDETKETSKTIDLCNNPRFKEAKVSMAKRIISGELFEESWVELDEVVQRYEEEYYASIRKIT